MVPNSPHMAWVDPGEGTFTCQVNRSIMVRIEPGSPRRESGAMTTTLLRLSAHFRPFYVAITPNYVKQTRQDENDKCDRFIVIRLSNTIESDKSG